MKKILISLCFLTVLFYGHTFSKSSYHIDPIGKIETIVHKSDYQYFSNLLVYPLNVDKIINIKNGGNTCFKVSIYDEKMVLVLSLNTSPYCSTSIVMDNFKSGNYTLNVSSESETHQFSFLKK